MKAARELNASTFCHELLMFMADTDTRYQPHLKLPSLTGVHAFAAVEQLFGNT
ncbi:hypothetical protein ACMXYO_08620 [Neptuniibacter sp. QD37_6]|uniref:hypothetical protein n=1 Tax=Neptuniibacter sp. QD37_6 TaxID=3398210 RepID=UPI0039F56C39